MLSTRVLQAADEQELWFDRIRAGLSALLVFLDEDPLWARLFVLEGQLGGALTEELVDRVRQALPEVLEESRSGLVVGRQLRPSATLIAELVVLGVLSLLRTRILRPQHGSLGELEDHLMLYVVEPYLARGAMRSDREAKPPAGRHAGLIVEQVPFRPHPRILLMLQSIASEPRMTSSQVAQAVRSDETRHDVSDLFKPLERRGLIEDVNAHKAVGTTRAWVLTTYGCRVLDAMTGRRWTRHTEVTAAAGAQSAGWWST